MHCAGTRLGLVVVDAAMNLVASNNEAVQILTFPQQPEKLRSLEALLSQRVRTDLLNPRPGDRSDFVKEFRSGNRTYLCHSFTLSSAAKSASGTSLVLLLERRPSNAVPISEVSDEFGLTPREQNTIHLLLRGLTTKEIAREMKISPNTVKAFLRLVMVKMGVSTRSGIVGKIVGSATHTVQHPQGNGHA